MSKKTVAITKPEKSLWSDGPLENRKPIFNFQLTSGELSRVKITEPKDNSSEEKKYKSSFSGEFFSKIIK